MNPEFLRNVWLELTPLRLIVLAAVLALVFFAAALTEGIAGPGSAARFLFAAITVVWGTRNAARAVVGEIQGRTWDGQRLSSLGPGTMMWGKLFGATIFNWVGGTVCLLVILADGVERFGVLSALWEVVYWIAMGIIAQGASLLASLIAARRRQGRSQFEVFFYQVAGLAAAIAVWAIADPGGPSFGIFAKTDIVLWWNLAIEKPAFYLASLAVFTGWMLAACYRQMRLELMLSNGPWVWLAFLVFTGFYIAGFAECGATTFDPVTCRLAAAAAAMAVLVYITLVLEPKSRVQLRWLGGAFGAGQFGKAFSHLAGWMMAYLAAMLLTLALVAHMALVGHTAELATPLAALGFVTRDIGLVMMMNMLARRRGGDFLAIAMLVLLYALMPAIVAGMSYATGQALFLPKPTDPAWWSPAAAWLQAVAIWMVVVSRLALAEDRAD